MNGDGGAAQGRQETHFLGTADLPSDFGGLPDFDISELKNFVPEGFSADPNGVVYNDRDLEASDVNQWIGLASGGATNFADLIAGGVNDDKIAAGAGHDRVWGGSGDDLIYGNNGNDKLEGNMGNDRLYGQSGVDSLKGGFGDDYLNGGAKSDWLYGNQGEDELHGGNGADYLNGGQGNDVLLGGNGNDTIRGGGGNDEIKGGKGRDELWGDYYSSNGSYGADVFVFKQDHMIDHKQTGWDPTELDIVHDFHVGLDTLEFIGMGSPGTTQELRNEFSAWEPGSNGSQYGSDTHFVLMHKATNKAILVNVQDGT
jgi:Ca2+-binding RTX toxin-like protein